MEIKMAKVILEKQGRILIPKKIREKIGLRSGEEINLQIEGDKLVLKPLKPAVDFILELKGCVKEGKIDPLELKKIWVM